MLAVVVSLTLANVVQRVRGGLEVIELQRRVGEAILDTVDVGLVLLDGQGRYLTMNRRHHDFMRLAFPEVTVARPASSARSSTRTARRWSSTRRCRRTAPPRARSSTTS